MSKPKVLVTRRLPAAVEAVLAERFDATFNTSDRILSPAELGEALDRVDAVLPSVSDRIDAELLSNRRPRTRLLAACGIDESHIDLAAAKARGITVSATPDDLSACTADLTIMLMVTAARRAVCAAERTLGVLPSNDWGPSRLTGATLQGKTLGIVGFGRVGQQVARRAHWGFGMQVLAYDRSDVAPALLAASGVQQRKSLDAVIAEADFVSLHCPGDPENRHLIDSRRLDLMKPSAFLVNTSRGELVDGRALLHALWFDTIAGAALDAYDGEAAFLEDLKACPTAVLTPHLRRATAETHEAMGLRVVQNIEDFFAGRKPRDCVTA